jgi:D-xylose transport system substrate-binding protein
MSRRLFTIILLATLALGAACSRPAAVNSPVSKARVRIGFSMDTLQEERWQRDRDLFVAHARALGADVIVQAAAGDDYLQLSQAENMLARGVDVLVVVPHDAKAMGPIVAKAHEKGVKVIAYDRLITYGDVDFYLSFDAEKIGALQAGYLLQAVPTGNYVLIGGAPSDNNSYLIHRGVTSILDPAVKRGDIRIVYDEMTPDWNPQEARRLMEEAIAKTGGKIDAVIAANDATAGGAIQALFAHGLAGKVQVAGQDAERQALRRILDGTQTMTVYKPIKLLAGMAAEVAVDLARGGQPAATDTVANGSKAVPALLLQPVAVDRLNWTDTVVRDGFHTEAEILGIH